MSVLLTAPKINKTDVKCHPVFCEGSYEKVFNFVRPLRQHFDNFSTKCVHGNKSCHCFQSSEKYVHDFSVVEKNAALVTKGDWHSLLRPVFDDPSCTNKDFSGLPNSVTTVVREVRNQAAHADFDQQRSEIWNHIRAEMELLIMHCFACLIHIEPTPNPVLLAFADAFMKHEGKAYEAALKAKKVSKPTSILFRLKLFRADEYQSQTVFYLDAQDDEAKTFKNEAAQIFRLDKSTPLRISYMGKYEDSAIRDPFKEISLTTPNCISELDLDSSIFHLVHVEEKWKVKLHIDLPGKTLEHDLLSDDTMQQIQQLVLDDTKWDRALLYSGKNPVNNKAKIGDVSVDNIFKLFATDPMDKDRRDEYLSRI